MIEGVLNKRPAVVVVSSKWPDCDRSGVSLTAAKHVDLLSRNGFVTHVLSSCDVNCLNVQCETVSFVGARGAGSLYSPARVDTRRLRAAIVELAPAFVLVEAWQSAICEAAINVAYELKIPVAMISHGISVSAYSKHWFDRFRSMLWRRYEMNALPNAIRRLDAITTLDLRSASDRFLDRDIAAREGVPVFELTNSAINKASRFYSCVERGAYIVNVGYFSRIKNQLGLIGVLAQLPDYISLHLIGQRKGGYFARCQALVSKLRLNERVRFIEDTECNVGEEIARARLYASASITEALPVTLLEAMFAGTPFVSPDVGAVSALAAGGVICGSGDLVSKINDLFLDNNMWGRYSEGGRKLYSNRYSDDAVEMQLRDLTDFMIRQVR